jgi:hypothetical protein
VELGADSSCWRQVVRLRPLYLDGRGTGRWQRGIGIRNQVVRVYPFKAKGSSYRPEQPDEIVIMDGGGYAFYLHMCHNPTFFII